MSAEALRKAATDEIEKLNGNAMNDACRIRPSLQTTADGIALTVVDQLAMARAFAMAVNIINDEFRKLTSPPQETAPEKKQIKEMY